MKKLIVVCLMLLSQSCTKSLNKTCVCRAYQTGHIVTTFPGSAKSESDCKAQENSLNDVTCAIENE